MTVDTVAETPWAAERVIDCHFHERPTLEAMIAHLDGSGVSSALVLAFDDFEDRYSDSHAEHPGRFAGWARGPQLIPGERPGAGRNSSAFEMSAALSIVTAADTRTALRNLQDQGWKGFAETVGAVEVDGPALQRVYALASELDVPVMMHFQEAVVPGQPVYGIRGFSRIESMLKKYPSTRFVCHAPDFWGGIDSRYRDGGQYLTDRVSPGGLSDRLLSEYPNMFGDLGAPSALLQLTRDRDFTADFLTRHSGKLMFGSDCGCADGRGSVEAPTPAATELASGSPFDDIDAETAAAMQAAMAAAGGLAGRCIARELLSVIWTTTSRQDFRKLASTNAERIYRLD
ncbi:amidohydrolase family protein [Microbacterium sp. NPDC089698]|uniref:amidohydrolase family protein n=1 Tax=Microbacterium sp. NPDC089698 TaxID=3364200 RepID=UPI0037F87FC9